MTMNLTKQRSEEYHSQQKHNLQKKPWSNKKAIMANEDDHKNTNTIYKLQWWETSISMTMIMEGQGVVDGGERKGESGKGGGGGGGKRGGAKDCRAEVARHAKEGFHG